MNISIFMFPVAAFLFGTVVVVCIVPLIRRWAHARALLDHPTEMRKIHTKPVPRIGGLAVYVGFLAVFGLASFLFLDQVRILDGWTQLFWVVSAMFSLGFWDDIRRLGAKKKLTGQILIGLVAYWMGLRIENITSPFSDAFLDIGFWGLPITVLWLVATTNLINLIDGLDGLAAGVSLFLMAVMAALAALRGSLPMLCLAIGVAGVLIGFLFFNFPPAKIFLGDGGAYFLGCLIGSMALVQSSKGEVVAAMVVPFFALGLPILDTGLTIVRRGIQGLPVFRGDRQHIHHRLLDLGFSRRRSVVFLYLICVLCSLVAAAIFVVGSRWWALLLGLLFTLALYSVRGLGYVKSWDKLGLQLAGSAEKRRKVQLALHLSKILVIEAENAGGWGDFRSAVAEKLEKLEFHSFKLRSVVQGIEKFDWKPAHASPWNIESAEWVKQSRSLQVGSIIVGEFTLFGYVEEDLMDHFDRLADVLGEAIEEGFQICHRKFVT